MENALAQAALTPKVSLSGTIEARDVNGEVVLQATFETDTIPLCEGDSEEDQ